MRDLSALANMALTSVRNELDLVSSRRERLILGGHAATWWGAAREFLGIARGTQHEVQRRSTSVDCPVEIAPLLFNPDVRLIDAVGIVGEAQVRSTPSVEFGRIALDPAKHGRMIDGDASFAQELFDVTIAQGVAQIPSHRTKDDIRFE